MNLVNTEKKQSSSRPLKRAKTGLETEMHVINSKGKISYKGLELIDAVKKQFPEVEIVKECGQNMIEFGTYPDINAYNPALEILESIEKTIKVAKKLNLRIYPFATYPGKIEEKLTSSDGLYKIQEKIFGKEKFSYAVKAVGFHNHYTMPKGVFDFEKKDLKLLVNSKLKRSLLHSYNFLIAIDPILTLFTQSSPFFENTLLAKDSRMLIYRGGKKLAYPGLYSNTQQLGGLPPYKQTATDLIRSLSRRQLRWKKLVKNVSPEFDFDKKYPNKLIISWNPVKVNRHGTLEQRGMDMNYISIVLACSALIKFALRKIQRDFIEVLPADVGIKNPFKINNGIMFIPPHTHVRVKLQKASAYEGFENDELYSYTKSFMKFIKPLMPDFYKPLIKKIDLMIKKRKSTSDEIIAYAIRNELLSKYETITDKGASKIALHFSKKFEKDLEKTKKIVMNIMSAHQVIKNNLALK